MAAVRNQRKGGAFSSKGFESFRDNSIFREKTPLIPWSYYREISRSPRFTTWTRPKVLLFFSETFRRRNRCEESRRIVNRGENNHEIITISRSFERLLSMYANCSHRLANDHQRRSMNTGLTHNGQDEELRTGEFCYYRSQIFFSKITRNI